MKLWIDDTRPAPDGYVWCKSTTEAITVMYWYYQHRDHIQRYMSEPQTFPDIEIIDIGYDAGEYISDGGNYVEVLNWLEYYHRNYPIRIHSMNPVGVANMRAIIEKNGWREVF